MLGELEVCTVGKQVLWVLLRTVFFKHILVMYRAIFFPYSKYPLLLHIIVRNESHCIYSCKSIICIVMVKLYVVDASVLWIILYCRGPQILQKSRGLLMPDRWNTISILRTQNCGVICETHYSLLPGALFIWSNWWGGCSEEPIS
jgi:hypothetical protein